MTVTNWVCDCGNDLKNDAHEAAEVVPVGTRRVFVTCPLCDAIYSFAVDWSPTVRPEPLGTIVTIQAK